MPTPLTAAAAGRAAAARTTAEDRAEAKTTQKSAQVLKPEPTAPSQTHGSKKLTAEKISAAYDEAFESAHQDAIDEGMTANEAVIKATHVANVVTDRSLKACDNQKDKKTCIDARNKARESTVYQQALTATGDATGGLEYEAAQLTALAVTPKNKQFFGKAPINTVIGILERQTFANMTLKECTALLKHLNQPKSTALTAAENSQRKALRVLVNHNTYNKMQKLSDDLKGVADTLGGLMHALLGGIPQMTNNPSERKPRETDGEMSDREQKKSEEDFSPTKITINATQAGNANPKSNPALLP